MALSHPQDVNIPLEKRKILRKLLLKKGITLEDHKIDLLATKLELLAYAIEYADISEAFQHNTQEEKNDEG